MGRRMDQILEAALLWQERTGSRPTTLRVNPAVGRELAMELCCRVSHMQQDPTILWLDMHMQPVEVHGIQVSVVKIKTRWSDYDDIFNAGFNHRSPFR